MARRRAGYVVGVCVGVAVMLDLTGCGGGSGGTTPPGGSMDMDAAMMMPSTPGNSPDAPISSPALRFLSQPIDGIVAGETFRYRARASEPSATFVGATLPTNATIDSSGNLTWTPSVAQGGSNHFTIKATAAGLAAAQEFDVVVASPRPQQTGVVDPTAPATTTITVDAPLSKLRGAAVEIEPGSLVADDKLSISISSLDNPPVPPIARIAGVGSKLTPVELGPSGTAFRKPARVQLPASADLLKTGQPQVLTLDPSTGSWEGVKVLAVDTTQNLVTAEIQHFSTYVVVPDVSLLDAKLSKGGAGTPCADALIVRAGLAKSPASLPADTVNGYSGTATDLAGVLAGVAPGQGIQTFMHTRAQSANGARSEEGWILVAAIKAADGRFNVTQISDRQSMPILSVLGQPAGDDNFLALLGGHKGEFIFGNLGDLSAGASATVDLSFYLVDGADANRPPVSSVNQVAKETFTNASLPNDTAGTTGYDDDCDQIADADDPEPHGDRIPRLVGIPGSPLHLIVGKAASIAVSADIADTTFAWTPSDPSLVVSGTGAQTMVTASHAGVYRLDVLGTHGKAIGLFSWDVIVDDASVMTANTPPTVQIAASQAVARVGETVVLQAIGRDREQVDLTYRWQASDATVLSGGTGPRVAFLASAPGDYKVACTGNDGIVDSAVAGVVLTVLAPSANRPPGAPIVTPPSALLTHAPGEGVTVTLLASATDPDGDAVTFDFVPDPSVSRAVQLTKTAAMAEIHTIVDGAFVFYVTAQDSHGAVGPATAVKIQVLPTIALNQNATDADHDGYPAGADCNDNDAKIFPGSREICGDNIDQDCDGYDLPTSSCDEDGDRFTVMQGDCDDHDPKRNPAMAERCDGIDNNCNNQIDEGFEVGKACANGVGACRAEGKTKCSASFVTVICDAVVGRPAAETCDMVDNDCNGKVDDVMAGATGTLDSCGSCGVACPTPPGSVAMCVNGGCVAKCMPGFVDLDRQPQNGCECAVTNNGVEACDNLDNDCNGLVDDNVTQSNYGAAFITLGIGVCSGATKVCRAGVWVDDKPAKLPMPEICDGLDNDCNGIPDDGFDLKNDAANCGGCGLACGNRGPCVGGKCVGAGDGGVPMVPPPSGGGTGSGPAAGQGTICVYADGTKACVDLTNDPGNCGGCMRKCPADNICYGAMCVTKDKLPAGGLPAPAALTCSAPPPPVDGGTGAPPADAGPRDCPQPLVTCADPAGNKFCTDPMADPKNCGACGKVCPTGFCKAGICTDPPPQPDAGAGTCPPELATCPNAAGQAFCTKILYDPMNCGRCGLVCGANTVCMDGKCQPYSPPDGGATGSCPPGFATCTPKPGATICADLNFDRNNCGGCNVACMATDVCMMGKCVLGASADAGAGGCPMPLKQCPVAGGLVCVDVTVDKANCGACGNLCPPDLFCMSGRCAVPPPPPDGGATPPTQPTCPAEAPPCKDPAGNLVCTKLQFDPKNCGACGKICGANQTCNQGVCVAP